MNESKLKLLVMEAIDLDRTIAQETERLKKLKAQIIQCAEVPTQERTLTDGGGWSVEFEGATGDIARVTKPGDKLRSSLDAESPTWGKIKELLKGREDLFKPALHYKPAAEFRKLLELTFPPGPGKKLLALMTTKSATTVSFETKEAA